MSAISGLYHLDGRRADTAMLDAMMRTLEAFGPDGAQCWHTGPVAFGHQQRWVTLESKHESLPWHDAQLGLTLTAVSRLDNRDALCHALGLSRCEAAMLADSHLILHAYAKWGTSCLDHLLGDFAFAIWDARQQHLFCARDLFGVTPFFYSQHGSQFCFASTLAAVCAASDAGHEIDYRHLAAYFRSGGNAPYTEHTWYAGVRRLMPAHAMIVSAAGMRTWAYWQPEQIPALPPASEAAYIEQLADLFEQAVACRTRSAYPVGAHLSGGLDFSGVTALAARQAPQHGRGFAAFSWSPPLEGEPEADDERVLVEAVRVAEGIPCRYAPGTLHDMTVTRLQPLDLPERRFFPESHVRRLAREQGIRVMLSGWGGDELAAFNGRGYLADLWRRGQWWTLWRESAAYAQRRGFRTGQVLRGKGLLPHIPDRLLPFAIRPGSRPSLMRSPKLLVPQALHPDFADKLVQADPGPLPVQRERPGARRNQLELLAHGHIPTRAEWWATEAPESGLDYRYPMLDRRLVEFSLGLPPQFYFRSGWSRYILRRALEGIVPSLVQWNWNKAEAVRLAYVLTLQREWHRQVLRPLMAEVLSDYKCFESLDPIRVREAVQIVVSNPESDRMPIGPLVLRLEMMMNRPLAMDVQTWLRARQPGCVY